ncbi:MAG: antibiotic biosynthesis monooxygenase [Pseudomonadales bacterium]|nr:antibiotic biosynthesis monooxygenase [Pseudomonadales bacterium]
MTYQVFIESTANPDTLDSLMNFLEENLPNVRSFKGCLKVSILFDSETHQMLFEEEWITKENHQAYMQSIEENGILGALSEHLLGMPKISYYQKLDI